MKKKPVHYYYHQGSGRTVSLRPVCLQDDFDSLYDWMHQAHVIPNWRLNKSREELFKHFSKALRDHHQSLFIILIDGEEIGYAETYHAVRDRLANFCKVRANDYGLHLLIGRAAALGKGYCEPVLCALTDYLFVHYHAGRVLVEPNREVRQLTILERKLGFANLGEVKLPEKIATLYAVDAAQFYRINPLVLRIKQLEQTQIHCDTSDWPLVRIHFPDHPQEEDVKQWLHECEMILARDERCVVLATFAEHYQFSASARRYQALWFKRNVARLAASCIAMLRVTRDLQMIGKITTNAMRKGMPFICIPASSVNSAEDIARRLLANNVVIRQDTL